MNSRTWNLKLMATDQHPETTLKNVSQEEATKLVHALMYGPGSVDYAHVEAAVHAARDRHEGPLAA